MRDEFAVDQEIEAILRHFVYCSEFTRMNDPMEGFYRTSKVLKEKSNYRNIVRRITASKSGIGIACFTESYDDVLMWTHYAGNYSGMCVAYSTNALKGGLPRHVSLARLSYVDEPPLVQLGHARNADEAAMRILSQKKYNWAYEREWRVLGHVGPVNYGPDQAVRRIYFGSRVSSKHRQRVLSKLQGTEIEAYMMEVDGYRHTWGPVNKAAKQKKGHK